MSKKLKKNSDIKLTITMLVSNRRDTIRKCMESISPILQQVSSELIVVDTGSTDGSIDIVKEYTDKIIPFTWCNDFSAARNAGLKNVKGEWVMFLDDDEWFEDVKEIIEFFNSGEYRQYNSGVYIVRNYGNLKGTTWSDSNGNRMVKYCPKTEFRGKIHEYIWPQVSPTKYFNVYAHHYGYVFSDVSQGKEHSRRNINLIEEELKTAPKDLRLRIQAIQEYFCVGEIRKVLEICYDVMKDYEENKEIKIQAGYCSNHILRSYIALEEWEKGYEYGNEVLAKGVPTAISFLGNLREMIKICRKSERYEEGIRCLKKYLKTFDILSKEIDKGEILLDLSKYLQENERERVYQEGIILGVLAKDSDISEECVRAMDWNRLPLSLYPDTIDYLVKHLANVEINQKHHEVWNILLKKDLYAPQIENNIKKYSDEKEKYYKLLSLFRESTESTEFIKKYRFYYHTYFAKDWSIEEENTELELLLDKMKNPLLMEDDLWTIIDDKGLCLDNNIQNISYIRWFTLVREWMEEGLRENVNIEKTYRILSNKGKTGLHYQFMELKYKEFIICKQNLDVLDDGIFILLEDYSSKALTIYKKMYTPYVFEENNITILPPEGVFGFYIKEALEKKKKGNISEYSKLLLKAGQSHPGMKNLCKCLLKLEKEKVDQITQEENEFAVLAVQIKSKIRLLIQEGNYEAARSIIQSLEKLLPEDGELEEFKILVN